MATRASATSPWRYRLVNLALFAFISGFISFATMIGTTFFTSDHVATFRDVKHLQYGFPIAWVSQDQSAFTDRHHLPGSASMQSPHHNVTDMRLSPLLLDLLIVGAMPGAAYLVVTSAGRVIRHASGRSSGITAAVA